MNLSYGRGALAAAIVLLASLAHASMGVTEIVGRDG